MKCPYCDNGISRYSAPGFRWPCTICDGTGEVEMTEQEYIQTCNTEQLVDAIFDCTMANSWNFSKDGIKRWLKQPHRE